MNRGRTGAAAITLSGLLALALAGASASCARGPGLDRSSSASAACPPGTELGRPGCLCRPDLRPVLGACVSPRTAAAFCGPIAVPTEAGCAPRAPCERGLARDLGSGACLPRREVRAIAVGLGILVGDDEQVGCPGGGILAAESDGAGGPSRLGCLPRPPPPGRTCPAGALAGANDACVRVYDRGTVDVAAWLRAASSSPLCEALARRPGALDPQRRTRPGSAVSLVFPDNDVSQVRSSSTAELEGALSPMLDALRSLGGTATQAALSVQVACGRGGRPGGEERPAALTPENDHEK